jgi:hypothetical protein
MVVDFSEKGFYSPYTSTEVIHETESRELAAEFKGSEYLNIT